MDIRNAHRTFSLSGRLVLGRELTPGAVVVEDNRITAILRDPEPRDIPKPTYEADLISPGFIDLQVNGGFGVEVGTDPEALRCLAARLPETGVTAFLPTIVTSPLDLYPRAHAAFESARDAAGSRILGLHLEGPFLSPQRRGAHRAELIRPPNLEQLQQLAGGSGTRLVTLAPEEPGALTCIRALRERGIVVSLGHTNASYEEFVAGVDEGATMATHLYNAMTPLEHRAPGAVGAALLDDRVTVGLIADGVHSHPAAVKLAVRAKGVDRVALVTDMMAGAGMEPGQYDLAGQQVLVDGRSARLRDGTLAGSILTMDQAIRNTVRWAELSPAEAIAMASEVPAGILGLSGKGSIRVGFDADLVLLDRDLAVEATFVGGRCAYSRGAAL